MSKRLTPDDYKQIKNLYEQKYTIKEICEELHFYKTTVSTYLKSIGFTLTNSGQFKKQYSFDESYFERIDTEDKAYILGLFFADGSISRNSFQLTLKNQDKELLEKINKCIDSNYPIYYRPAHGGYENAKDQNFIGITSKKLYNDLFKLNMKNKDTIKNLIPKKLMSHFIRGVFDGDGCICNYSRKNECEFYILAFESLLIEFNEYFKDNDIIFNNPKHKKAYIYKIRKSGKNNIIQIYNLLYKDASIYMNRKHQIWEVIINE